MASPHPRGRPPIDADVKRALQSALPGAINDLIHLSKHAKRDADRIRCLEVLIERVLGKSAQPLVGPDGGAVQIAAVVVMPSMLDDG